MKPTFIALLALVVAVGCGGSKEKEAKEPELRSEKVITPDEAANELFVEAVELVSEAQSKETTDIPAAIKSYEQALVKVRKIVNEYKKSSLAVKLVSDEALLKGKTMAQIEERANGLKKQRLVKFMGMVTNNAIFEGQIKLKQNGLYEFTGHFTKHSTNAAGGIDIDPANGSQKGEPFSFETHIPEVFIVPLLVSGKFESVPEE